MLDKNSAESGSFIWPILRNASPTFLTAEPSVDMFRSQLSSMSLTHPPAQLPPFHSSGDFGPYPFKQLQIGDQEILQTAFSPQVPYRSQGLLSLGACQTFRHTFDLESHSMRFITPSFMYVGSTSGMPMNMARSHCPPLQYTEDPYQTKSWGGLSGMIPTVNLPGDGSLHSSRK